MLESTGRYLRHPLFVRLAVVSALFAAVPMMIVVAVPDLADPDALQAFVAGFGSMAVLAFVVLQALQVLVAPVPGQALVLGGGVLFGAVGGLAYSLLGMTVGSWLAFLLSRRYGYRYVHLLVGEGYVDAVENFVGRAGAGGVLLAFLVPGLSDDVICYVAGLTDVGVPTLVAVSVAGRLPAVLVASVIGATLAAGNVYPAVAVVVVLATLWVVGYRYRRRLLAVVRRRLDPPGQPAGR